MYNSVTKHEVFVLLDLQVCSRCSSGTLVFFVGKTGPLLMFTKRLKLTFDP